MVFHMKTTLNISDATMREVKREAARRRQTMSAWIESALRAALERPARGAVALPPLPRFRSGGARVDIANRDALYTAMQD
jgi:hypothetical protein